jgi:hypothetical protein
MTNAAAVSPTQIDYVVVELFIKDGTINTKPELGLFRGLRLRTEKKPDDTSKIGFLNLILLGQVGQNNTLNGFSHDFYKVMSIRLGYGVTKEYMIFKSTEDDQKLALEILGAILDTLREEKKMLENDSEIVDLDKYKNLPYDLEKATTTTNTAGAGVGYNNYSNRNVGSTTTDWEKKRKEEEAEKARQEVLRYTPYMVKRVSQLPDSALLKSMKEKVAAISAKTYKAPELPEIKECVTTTTEDTKALPPPPPAVYQGE